MAKRPAHKKRKADSAAIGRERRFDRAAYWKALLSSPLRAAADPRQWQTEIPELVASPLKRGDHRQVLECMSAIDPILARGATVAMRMEFAAAMLASACANAYESADAQGARGHGPERFYSAEDLILRRARELYAQGRA
jgi:hypothetical protein